MRFRRFTPEGHLQVLEDGLHGAAGDALLAAELDDEPAP